jgi:heme/copper-type cytochrome/quinol oxidase subunit 3
MSAVRGHCGSGGASAPYPAVDASRFVAYGRSHEMPIWWGVVGLIIVESVVFSTLLASYFYLGFRQPEWPLPGVGAPDLLMPLVGTAFLLVSSVSMHRADKAIDSDDQRTLRLSLMISIALAAVFLALKVHEYAGKDYRWDSHPYGSIVWLVIGFHATHVVSLLLKTLVVCVLAFRGFFHRTNRLALVINGFYWHFVVMVWIPIFLVIYISPRLS